MKSFFTLTEEINQYSPQALGRKRNTMLRALTLDDGEFERWVHDRVIRFAEHNRLPLQQLDISSFKAGFQEWTQQFQQTDKSYNDAKDQIDQYITRFLSVVPNIIAKYQSGMMPPVKEPMSPQMAKFEGDGSDASQQIDNSSEDPNVEQEQQYASAPPPISVEQIQGTQRDVMNMLDITNPIANMGEDESRINRAAWNENVRNMADLIAQTNQVDRNNLNYDMIDTYIKSIRNNIETNADSDLDLSQNDLDMWEANIKKEFFDQYGIKKPQQEAEERARLIAQQELVQSAINPDVIKMIHAEDAETGLISAIERLTGSTHLSPVAKAKTDKKMSDVHKKYFDIQAKALFEKYTFLKGASFKSIGRKQGKLTDAWKEHGSTAPSSKTTKTDIVATLPEGNYVRYDDSRGSFSRCSMREIEEGNCTNQINFSFKKGKNQIMSGRGQETRATLEVALANLTQQGYSFDDVSSLASTIATNRGLDEEIASQQSQQIIESVKQLRQLAKSFVEGKTYKGQVSFYQQGGSYRDNENPDLQKTQEVIDSAEPFLEQINNAITSLSNNLPELIGEMAYLAASGDGKFEQNSNEIATHFLSLSNTDPESGPKIIPITRKIMNNLAMSGLDTRVYWKSNSIQSVKKKLKPMYTKSGLEQGLEGQELETYVREKLDAELPYSFSTVLRMIMGELSDTRMEHTVTIGSLLQEEAEENVFDRVPGVSDTTKKYTQEAFNWGFSNLENITNFFEMNSEVGDINLPDFSQDFGDTYFKKEIQDEMQDFEQNFGIL